MVMMVMLSYLRACCSTTGARLAISIKYIRMTIENSPHPFSVTSNGGASSANHTIHTSWLCHYQICKETQKVE
jgi:hypothetical protein